MDAHTKTSFKAQLSALRASNSAFKSVMGMTPAPVMGGMPPMPIMIQPAIAPHLAALQQHAEEFDKLIRIVNDIVDKS